jgi:hypothetical protein
MLIMAGSMGAINGLIALLQDEAYLVTEDRVVLFDFTQWGWIHLVGGIVVAIAGLFVATVGATWARIVGIFVAFFHALGQVAFIEAYPFWTIMTIALDIIVIYGLLVFAEDEAAAT